MDCRSVITVVVLLLWMELPGETWSDGAIYVGCYRDSSSDPALDEDNFRGGFRRRMTHDQCFERCRSSYLPYAGLQDSRQCFCGYDYDEYGPLEENFCNTPCSGNSSQTCGGEMANSVFLLGYTEVTCERQVLHLDCGDHFISIRSASYGSDPADGQSTCPSQTSAVCAASASLVSVQDACQDEHSCSVPSSNDVFGDPCSGVEKYLKVTYSCPKYNTTIRDLIAAHGSKVVTTSTPHVTGTTHGLDLTTSTPPAAGTTHGPHLTTNIPHVVGTTEHDLVPSTVGYDDVAVPTNIGGPDVPYVKPAYALPNFVLACSSPVQVGKAMVCTLDRGSGESELQQVFIDYGDGLAKHPVSLEAGRTVKELHHVYEETGRYDVTVELANTVQFIEEVTIVDVPCALSSISIKGISEDQAQPTTFLRSSQLRLSSSVELDCSLEVQMLFGWMLYSYSGDLETEHIPSLDIARNTSQLVIPSRGLAAGQYRVRLQVTLVHADGDVLGQRGFNGWFLIEHSDLVALISGGSQRTFGLGSAVTLDGSSSHDPDFDEAGPADDDLLNFAWSCLPASGHSESASSNITCDGSPLGHTSIFVFHPETALAPGTLHFYLKVEKGDRTATTSQQIVFVAGDPPQVSVSCIQNCDLYIRPASRLVLRAICDDCSSTPTYFWRFFHQTERQGKVSERFDWRGSTLTGRKQDYIVMKSHALDGLLPGLYYLQVSVRHDGNVGKSEYSFAINTPPGNGTCHVTPTNGTVLSTQFIVACEGFVDVDQPLSYAVYRIQPNNADYLLASYPDPVSPALYPPLGNESDGYNLHLKVKVSDVYGGSTATQLTIQVFPVSLESNVGLGEQLLNMSTGSTSLLGNLITSGNKEAANQVVVSMATLLNEPMGNGTESLDKDTRKKIRSTLIESLSSLDLQSAEDIEQSSASLGLITDASEELSPETQVKAVDLISSMTSFMKQEVSSKSSFSSEQVEKSSNQLAAGLSNILGAAMVVEASNESAAAEVTDTQQQRTVILSVINTIDTVQDVLAVNKIPGEAVTSIQTSAFGLSVSRESSNRLGDMQMNSPKGDGWFQLPANERFLSNGTSNQSEAVVDIQLVEMSDNPFSWGSDTTEVTSGVMGLKLKMDDAEIKVSGLVEDYISLMLEQPSQPDPELFQVIAGSLVALSINGTDSDSDLVQLTILPSAASTAIYVCVLTNYSTNIFSDVEGLCVQNFTFPRENHVETASVESTYTWTGEVPQQDGRINLHVRAGDIPAPKDWFNSALNLSVYTSSPDCLFWDEGDETWSNRGCQLGPLSDPWFTHCLCDHLSYFGSSLLVRPNKIDLIGDAKLFLTFVDNPLVVCTVAAVFAVYLVVALWAYREDKRDLIKAQMTVLEDNDPYDHYRYLITVVTGWRRGASTTANVALTMHGSMGDSDPHILKSPDHPVLIAGAHDTFLLTTRESLGQVTSIRLWHDNAGSSPEWFVSRIQVHDLQTDVSYLFLCNSWLASTIDDGKIDRSFTIATEEKLSAVGNLFTSKTSDDFQDGHLWFSVLSRPARSSFTRVQRVSCCFSLLMTAMMTNIMFYGIPVEPGEQVLDFGAMRITIKEIIIGIEGAIIAFPINLIIVSIFRHARPSQSRSEIYKHHRPAAGESESGKTSTSGASSFKGEEKDLTNKKWKEGQGRVVKKAEKLHLPPGFESINVESQMASSRDHLLGASYKDSSSDSRIGEADQKTSRESGFVSTEEGWPRALSVDSAKVSFKKNKIDTPGSDILKGQVGREEISSQSFVQEPTSFDSLSRLLVQGAIDDAIENYDSNSWVDIQVDGKAVDESDEVTLKGHNWLMYTQLMDMVMELEHMSPLCFSSKEEYQKALHEARVLVLTAISVATPSSSSYDTSVNSLEGKVYSSEEDGDSWRRKQPKWVKKNKKKGLPHFSVYIGWLLLIVTCLGSAYVTMLYGLKYGMQRSLDWLMSLIVSTVQSIFITQPIKIVLLAIFLSMIFRRWEEEDDGAEDFESDFEEQEIENAEAIHAKMLEEKEADARYHPPASETSEKHKLLKEKEHQLYDLLQEIVGYLIFIWLLVIITYSRRDKYAFHLTQNIKNRYFEGNKIYNVNLTHFKGFFEWTESVVVPNLYGTSDYEADTQSLLLGGLRIRQLRVRPDSCTLVKTIKESETNFPGCWSPYSRLSEDTRSFNGSWGHPTTPSDDTFDPWHHQGDISLPYSGKITIYQKGGYVWYLGSDLSEAVGNVVEMKARRWLDEHTRAIFVDWTVYNANINMFGVVTCLLETPAGGGMLKTFTVHSVRLYRSSSNTSMFVTLCEVAFSIYLLYYMYREICHFKEKRWRYWLSIWNWLEVIIIVNTLIMIALYIVQLVFVQKLFREYRRQPGQFYDFREGAMMENNLTYSSAFLVILSTVKFLHLLRLNPRMYLLTSVLFRSAPEVMGFMFLIFLLTCTFSLFLTLCIGTMVSNYRSYLISFITLYNTIPGNFDVSEVRVAARYFGPFAVFVFQCLSFFLFLNLLISALNANMIDVRKNPKMSKDGIMGLLLLKKILSFFGIRKKVKVDV